MFKRRLILFINLVAFIALAAFWITSPADRAADQPQMTAGRSVGSGNLQNADSPELSDGVWESMSEPVLSRPARSLPVLTADDLVPQLDREINPRLNFTGDLNPNYRPREGVDPLLARQRAAVSAAPDGFDTPVLNFAGQGYSFLNPPDTTGDVGPNHYVQIINGSNGASVVIYDKNGTVETGPFFLDGLASGTCTIGGGDGIVLYDHLADRWLLSEFPDSRLVNDPNRLCVYMSQTSDPAGSYFVYEFTTPNFPDYPKYGLWPDAFYVSSNESGNPPVYAISRAELLSGATGVIQRTTASNLNGFGFQALTPADLDGPAPPNNEPGIFLRHRDDEVHNGGPDGSRDFIEIWEMDPDFSNASNSTFSKVADIPIAEFSSDICGLTSFSCVPQPSGGAGLDPLREVIMFRVQYRNFGSHEVLVGNFATDVSGSDHVGIRWFELRRTTGDWELHQEGTIAPDSHHRWMGSAAMDGSGNIAIGYNVASSTLHASLRYAGRQSSEPLGTMGSVDNVIVNGGGVNGSERYGDYSTLSVDPADDCTFWFTGEYNPTSSWGTQITAFKFDGCSGNLNETISVAIDPQSTLSCVDETVQVSTIINSVNGYSGTVTMQANDLPGGTGASFVPSTVSLGTTASSQLQLTNLPVGTHMISIGGVDGDISAFETFSAVVSAAAPAMLTGLSPESGAQNQSTVPTFSWDAASGALSYQLQVSLDQSFSNMVINQSGISGTSFESPISLDSDTVYFWRVRAENGCGFGEFSSTAVFRTAGLAGQCLGGATTVDIFSTDFESDDGGFVSSGEGDQWTTSGARARSGDTSWYAENRNIVTDQRLTSPAVLIPADLQAPILEFWHFFDIEDDLPTTCWDGGVIELSTNGADWTQIDEEIIASPYSTDVSTLDLNPLAGQPAWCGTSDGWERVAVDLSDWQGQSVQFRMRLGTDSIVGREGWYVDDVVVLACEDNAVGFSTSSGSPQVGEAGETVIHTIEIINIGASTDDYTVLLGGSWPVTALPLTLSLDPGQSATVTVSVEVPAGSMRGDSEITTVEIKSENNPSLVQTEELLTFVPYTIYVPLSMRP